MPALAGASGMVLTVGSFDGLHRGHQALIQRARSLADARGWPLVALFFEPTAREYFSPASAPRRVLPLASKLARLADLGVDVAWCLRFGRQLSIMSGDDFAGRLAEMGVRAVVAGDDFRFGRGREGDAALLERFGIEAHTVPVVSTSLAGPGGAGVETVRCSSTRLRELLAQGAMAQAETILGAPYSLTGRVRRGRQLGRTLGCPTANMVFRRRLALAHGVYAGTARITDHYGLSANGDRPDEYPAVASFGVRPTLEGGLAPWLEVHLIDATLDLYGRYLTFHPRHFLRPEARFDSLDILREAIARDVADARAWLVAHPDPAVPVTRARAHPSTLFSPDPGSPAACLTATSP